MAVINVKWQEKKDKLILVLRIVFFRLTLKHIQISKHTYTVVLSKNENIGAIPLSILLLLLFRSSIDVVQMFNAICT